MVTTILLTTALAWTAQQPPDSTYLRLVGELPAAGTFSYQYVTATDRLDIFTELKDVEVERCALSFILKTRRFSPGTRTRLAPGLWESVVNIPLNAIDTTALDIRADHPPRNVRYEPQPWTLRLAIRRDTEERIRTRRIESSKSTPARRLDLSIRDYDTAVMVASWLRDAANRCETWSTTPLEPIR